MKEEKDLVKALVDAGFSTEMIHEHLPKFKRLAIELKAQEIDFWGRYFVSTARHYKEWGIKQIA